jgi:drug/metabolite transporter (DMT)-like permease
LHPSLATATLTASWTTIRFEVPRRGLSDRLGTVVMAERKRALRATTLLLVGFSVCMSIAAQLSLRHGMASLGDRGGLSLFLAAARSTWVPLGILFYGLGTVSWLALLARVDLAVAYPLGSLNHVFIALFAALLLNEVVPWLRWLGVALIVIGIFVIAHGERKTAA